MTVYVISESADDLMFETQNVTSARREIRRMRELPADQGDHRYFPMLIVWDAPRSPYHRKQRILERHTLTEETRYLTPRYMRENGEALVPGYPDIRD